MAPALGDGVAGLIFQQQHHMNMEIDLSQSIEEYEANMEKLFDSPNVMPAEDMDAKTVMVADSKRPAEPASPPDNYDGSSKHPKLSGSMPSIMEIGGMMKVDTCDKYEDDGKSDKYYEDDASESDYESDYVDWHQIMFTSETERPIEPPLSPDNEWLFSATPPSVSSGDDSLFGLANYIAPMVVKFLGVRSLLSFGATSKFQRGTCRMKSIVGRSALQRLRWR